MRGGIVRGDPPDGRVDRAAVRHRSLTCIDYLWRVLRVQVYELLAYCYCLKSEYRLTRTNKKRMLKQAFIAL